MSIVLGLGIEGQASALERPVLLSWGNEILSFPCQSTGSLRDITFSVNEVTENHPLLLPTTAVITAGSTGSALIAQRVSNITEDQARQYDFDPVSDIQYGTSLLS